MSDRLALGTWVKAERVAAPRGSWPYYQGRVGRIVAEAATADEQGVMLVDLKKGQWVKELAWFQPDELVEASRPTGAPTPRLMHWGGERENSAVQGLSGAEMGAVA